MRFDQQLRKEGCLCSEADAQSKPNNTLVCIWKLFRCQSLAQPKGFNAVGECGIRCRNARFNKWANEVDDTEAMKEPSRLSTLPRRASTTPTLA